MRNQAPGPAIAGSCDICGPSRRNRYYRDKRMHVADYVLEQEYHISRRRLVNRAMLGWGVVWGFAIDPDARTVGKGLALDPHGREIVACDDLKLGCGEDFLWLEKKGNSCGLTIGKPPRDPGEQAGKPENPQLYLLSAHYAEKRIEYLRIDDGCGGTRGEANQICETVVYSLRPIPCCAAGLPDCRSRSCAGEDTRACGQSDGQRACPHDEDEKERCFSLDRGNHRQLALWCLDPPRGFDICQPERLETAGCLQVDPNAGVPLACVTIDFHCEEPRVASIVDSAHPRRLARSNEVLFDLIRGCDLTRIGDVGWSGWLPPGGRTVPLSQFQKMFDGDADTGSSSNSRKRAVRTHFTVVFTGPVRVDTLTPDVFAMSLIQREQRENVGDIVRVPIVSLLPHNPQSGDPPGTTRGFTVLMELTFWRGEVSSDEASGFERPTLVEIEIRTDWILDCNSQEVAGGGRTVPSTGSAPGGRFLSSFTVVPDDQVVTGALPPRDAQ